MSAQKIGVGFGVMLIRDGKVLLGKRHDDPEKADSALRGEGTWTMPGGKLKFGESFEEGAVREVKEETGIDLHDVCVIGVNNDRIDKAHFVTLALHSESFSGEAQVLEPDEITQWKWFSFDDLPKNLFFASANILRNYHSKKFYHGGK